MSSSKGWDYTVSDVQYQDNPNERLLSLRDVSALLHLKEKTLVLSTDTGETDYAGQQIIDLYYLVRYAMDVIV